MARMQGRPLGWAALAVAEMGSPIEPIWSPYVEQGRLTVCIWLPLRLACLEQLSN